MILVWIGYVIFVGGDFMPFYRFVAPVWPLIAVLIGQSIYLTGIYLIKKYPHYHFFFKSMTLLIVGVAILGSMQISEKSGDLKIAKEWTREELHRKYIGEWLAGHYRREDWIAVRPAGSIPYYSKMRALDIYCLTNTHATQNAQFVKQHWVGHQLVNIDWILEKEPKIIIFDEHLYNFNNLPDIDSGKGVIETQWMNNPKHHLYELEKGNIKGDLWIQYYIRKNRNSINLN
jgi:hypothetical protein